MRDRAKQIDLMNRESLVIIGLKLKLNGYKNQFTKPYLKKEDLKKLILKEISSIKKK